MIVVGDCLFFDVCCLVFVCSRLLLLVGLFIRLFVCVPRSCVSLVFVVHCLLLVVCRGCPFIVRCWLLVVCRRFCLLFVFFVVVWCCALRIVPCLLLFVVSCLLFVVVCFLFVVLCF